MGFLRLWLVERQRQFRLLRRQEWIVRQVVAGGQGHLDGIRRFPITHQAAFDGLRDGLFRRRGEDHRLVAGALHVVDFHRHGQCLISRRASSRTPRAHPPAELVLQRPKAAVGLDHCAFS